MHFYNKLNFNLFVASANKVAVVGVISEGFATIVHPAAKAGATLIKYIDQSVKKFKKKVNE